MITITRPLSLSLVQRINSVGQELRTQLMLRGFDPKKDREILVTQFYKNGYHVLKYEIEKDSKWDYSSQYYSPHKSQGVKNMRLGVE